MINSNGPQGAPGRGAVRRGIRRTLPNTMLADLLLDLQVEIFVFFLIRFRLPLGGNDIEQFDFEGQQRIGRNDWRKATGPAGQVRRNPEHVLRADRRQGNTFIPTLDHPRQGKLGWRPPVAGAVEHLAIEQGSDLSENGVTPRNSLTNLNKIP